MTASTLLTDAMARPDLFVWNGRMDEASLRAWLDRNPWMGPCPGDLLAFWEETGGGDVFETETIYGPLSDPLLGDDIGAVNRQMRAEGMPARFVVYHVGLLTSAVDAASGEYVELEPDGFGVLRRFASLDEWYTATLRAEYAQRYGLA
jgi:hypothetical protein